MTTSSQLHIQALHQPTVNPRRYGLFTRIADGHNGRRDARGQLAREVGDNQQPTHSLGRLKADNDERCELEYRAAVTTAAILIDQARILDHKITADEAEIADLGERLTAARASAASEPTTTHATEQHLTPDVVAGRRQREVAARLSPLETAVRRAEDQLVQDRATRAEVRGQLETLWDGTKSRVFAIADYFERRATTQARAYLRRKPPKAGEAHPLMTRSMITAPDWAYQPNPWLPALETHTDPERNSDDA